MKLTWSQKVAKTYDNYRRSSDFPSSMLAKLKEELMAMSDDEINESFVRSEVELMKTEKWIEDFFKEKGEIKTITIHTNEEAIGKKRRYLEGILLGLDIVSKDNPKFNTMIDLILIKSNEYNNQLMEK